MAEYIASATSPTGRCITEFIAAPSGDAAVAILEGRGCREVVLHTDDIAAAICKIDVRARRLFSPRELVAIGRQGPMGFSLLLLRKLLVKFVTGTLIILAVLGVPFLLGHPWGWYQTVLASLLPGSALGMVGLAAFAAGRLRRALPAALAWGRWREVLRRLDRGRRPIRGLQRIWFRAVALAGLGDLGAGLQEAERIGEEEIVPQWLYWALLADIYSAARDEAKLLEAKTRAVEEGPDNPTLLLSLASALVLHKRATRQARELLDEARKHTLADVIRFAVPQLEGMIALEEGDGQAARHHLEHALREAAPHRYNPMFVRTDGLIRSYLSLAYCQLGDYEAARKQYQRVEPILRAHRADNLMTRCRQAAGL